MLFVIWFNFWQVSEDQGFELDGLYGSLPTSYIAKFSSDSTGELGDEIQLLWFFESISPH